MEKVLMKIDMAYVGFGGYQNAMMGIWIGFSSKGSGCCDMRHGFWAGEWTSYCKWTEKGQIEYFGKLMIKIAVWLSEAKVDRVEKLVGIPVEVTFDEPFGKMVEWRILTEVL